VAGGACERASPIGDESSSPTATSVVATPASVAQFAGTWYRHGVGARVAESGDIEASYRTYRWCTDEPPPCDRLNGSEIVSGGRLVGRIEPSTSRSARIVVNSDSAGLVADGEAVFELLEDGKARLGDVFLCGQQTVDTRECGA